MVRYPSATAAMPLLHAFWPMAIPAVFSTSLFSPSATPNEPVAVITLPLPSAIPAWAPTSTVFWLPMANE